MTADPKPRKRYKATPKEWAEIHAIVTARACQICFVRRATNAAHVVARSQGGDDWIDNLLGVCGMGNAAGCHGLLHNHDRAALAKARLAILSSPAIRAYVLNRKGEAWLDRAYPPYTDWAAA